MVTTSQVQDLQTTIKDDLEAGTWTNYGSCPNVHRDVQKKSSKNTWIEVLDTKGDFVQAVNGAIIMFEDQCELQILSPNREDLDKIYADTLNILVAARGYTFSKSGDGSKRARYAKRFTIKLKDI